MRFEKKPPAIPELHGSGDDGGRPPLETLGCTSPWPPPNSLRAVGELMLDREGTEIAALQPMMDRL